MKDGLHTPWSDEITLVYRTATSTSADADGYENPVDVKSDPPLLCSFTDGVSQSEFYRSMKAGAQASAEAEVWAADYDAFWPEGYMGKRLAELRGRRYEILRAFQSTFDTKTLILTEVIR